MKLLIEWKESKEQETHRFGVLNEGQIEPNAQQLEDEDEKIFFWLTTEEARAIGADYDGGDWVVLRCACDECEEDEQSISWSELAELTHATQVERFNFCMCEDTEDRTELPYADCPRAVTW